jgi:hypothetical protein
MACKIIKSLKNPNFCTWQYAAFQISQHWKTRFGGKGLSSSFFPVFSTAIRLMFIYFHHLHSQ